MQGLQTVVRYSSFKCSPSCKEALAGLVVTDSVSVENKKIKKIQDDSCIWVHSSAAFPDTDSGFSEVRDTGEFAKFS